MYRDGNTCTFRLLCVIIYAASSCMIRYQRVNTQQCLQPSCKYAKLLAGVIMVVSSLPGMPSKQAENELELIGITWVLGGSNNG